MVSNESIDKIPLKVGKICHEPKGFYMMMYKNTHSKEVK